MKTLYNQIPIGEDNPVSSLRLSKTWGLSERQTQRKVEKMINNNMPVCNRGRGCYRPKTKAEFAAYLETIRVKKCKYEKKHYRLKTMLERFDNLSIGL